MKCLLVEPEYKTKYPNIALCKLSTKLKSEGNSVYYCKGKEKNTLDNWNRKYDEIYITTLFTYESDVILETIKHYQHRYPKAKIDVGGIFATLMADYVEKETGIKPFIGYSKELDMVKPDYSLITTGTKWDDFSFVFTSRGCVNKCPYCAVPTLEPEQWINPCWKQTIELSRKNIMIHDNNITSLPIEHFIDVCAFLREHKLGVIFDNGFDCRLFNEGHLKALEGVHIISGGLRFAFDNMSEDGHIQRTLSLCIKGGISKSKITVYVLFNFNDTPKEAEYRMQELVKFGVRVYPQMYVPLNKKNRKDTFIGKHWTKELAREFRKFYLMMGYYTKWTFPAWLEKEKKHDLLKQFNGTEQVERTLIHGGYVGVDKIRSYKDTSPTISTPSGGGHLPYVLETKVQAVKEPDEPVSTLDTQDRDGVMISNKHNTRIRRLTPRECERLQGFPDGHTDGHSDTQRYKQLGNAVTVNVIEVLGRSFLTTESLASFDMKKKRKIRMFLDGWL